MVIAVEIVTLIWAERLFVFISYCGYAGGCVAVSTSVDGVRGVPSTSTPPRWAWNARASRVNTPFRCHVAIALASLAPVALTFTAALARDDRPHRRVVVAHAAGSCMSTARDAPPPPSCTPGRANGAESVNSLCVVCSARAQARQPPPLCALRSDARAQG